MNSLQREKENNRKLQNNSKLEPYKTELRLEVIARRRELTRLHFLPRGRAEDKRVLKSGQGNVVTIDTNKARSNTDVVRLAVRDLGWREFPFQRRDQNCDITWHAISFNDQTEIYSGQVNKFPGSVEIFRKVNTFRWLELMKTLFPEQYDFFPRTWLLPHQFNEFANAVRLANEKKSKHRTMYIVKPSEGSQGQGIYLLDDPSSYSISSSSKSHVVQEYLSNVLLIDTYKFDLRVYVVLKSLEPLEFYICREGLARFSTLPYEKPNNKNMHETFMHLTNYSLNKKSNDFKVSDKDDEGSKRKMSAVLKMLHRMGHDVRLLWTKIEHLVTKTLIAVVGELKVEHQAALPSGKPGPTCFQVLGFDIILLNNLQPMLLEVNANPSLSITEEHESEDGCVNYVISSKDEDVKRMLIRDTLTLVAPKHKFTRRRRGHRQRRPNNNVEEDMDTNSSELHKHRRSHRRERDISVKHIDGVENLEKSMFGQPGISTSKSVTGYESRTLVTEDSKSDSTGTDDSSQGEISRMRSLKSWIRRKMGNPEGLLNVDNVNFLPELVAKSGNSSDEDVIMKEEEKGDQNHEEVYKEDKKDKEGEAEEEKEKGQEEEEKGEDKEEEVAEEEDCGGREPQIPANDNGQLESSDDDDDHEVDIGQAEEEYSCLKQIFPALYGSIFKNERLLESLADIFIMCLGVKGCLRLSPSMFRLFARKCHLSRKGMSSADIDVLYLDMQRKWEYMNPDRTSGLKFFAFVSACCKIASDVFSGNSLKAQVQTFIEHCQTFMKIPTEFDLEAAKRANRYGQGFSRSLGKDFLKLPLTDDKRRPRSLDLRPVLLEKSLNDVNFPVVHQRHRHVFHMLQSIKK